MFNIMVVEDDTQMRRLLCTVLTKNGYNALGAENGAAALDILDREIVDLIISDLMMPELDGYELTKQLREANYNMPILIITAREDFESKQKGFSLGTDDYMVKPIDVNEMVLRVGALLRRAKIANEHRINCGNTELDYDSLSVRNEDKTAVLPQKEFYLLYKLISYPDRIFTRQQLMDEIWGMESESDARTVDVHINRLRERFKDNADFEIITVRGLGYKVVRKS